MGSITYSNVTVTSVSATDVFFTYNHGMGNAKLKNLEPAWQKHFHFNPVKAQQVDEKQAAANAQYELNRHKDMPVSNKKIWANSLLNQRGPNLVVEKWLTGAPDCRGKFVLLDFWATWSPSSRKAIPALNGYFHKFGNQLVVIGISNETEQSVRQMGNPTIDYFLAIDTHERMKNALQITGMPHLILMDSRGIVRWEGNPFTPGYQLTENVIADIISRYSH